ncbi:MAG: energy transducer TonB [Sphingobacteriales bacterium]|nr:energy transducer TonB [Sphingobacteriales bacterium]MBK6891457.1 energy transducer TonB [Sphingobacteriales bacterium]MBK7526711.1 energy transducer TonB [Sphingobacteriales bacterium]MBL0248257.1 energy transducer TonB [Sphingobacteriales bacterium]
MDILDIVFEGRNKAYGAYDLRKVYPKHLRNSLIATVLGILFLVAIPYVKALVTPLLENNKEKSRVLEMELPPPPPMTNEPPPPPPPPELPPPEKPQVKFVEVEVKKDEEVVEEEKVADVEELKEAEVSTKTVEGDKNAVTKIDAPIEEVKEEKIEEVKVVEPPKPKEPEVFTIVEQQPEFDGGEGAMQKFIQKNLEYPAIARENNIQGTVYVEFVVGSKGDISKVRVVRGIGGGCDEEALRVVNKMPNWKPGKQGGQAVNVKFTLPIKFRLE